MHSRNQIEGERIPSVQLFNLVDSERPNMAQRQRDIVFGYVRTNYETLIIDDIINIIYDYYLIRIASKILNVEEQSLFMELIFHRLKQQSENTDIKNIDTKLLFRESDYATLDHTNKCIKFQELCTGEGPTISIFHNNVDHIFGCYISKSWT